MHFESNWIDKNGPVLWPPSSLDLTRCNFFLWGQVYATPGNSVDKLTAPVNAVAETILQNLKTMSERIHI